MPAQISTGKKACSCSVADQDLVPKSSSETETRIAKLHDSGAMIRRQKSTVKSSRILLEFKFRGSFVIDGAIGSGPRSDRGFDFRRRDHLLRSFALRHFVQINLFANLRKVAMIISSHIKRPEIALKITRQQKNKRRLQQA